jgi:hypothetical protein
MDLAALSTAPQRPPIAIEVARPAPAAPAAPAASDTAKPERGFWQRAFGDDGFSFGTLLDIVNPLQHIPVVSTIYQKLTGDETSPGANIIGGALFGGPIGLLVAAADSALKGETGRDTGEHMFALFDAPAPSDVAVADGSKQGAQAAAAAAVGADAEATPADASDEQSDSDTARIADTPALVAPADSPKPGAQQLAAASDAPRSAFVRANSMRHAPGHGIGGAFVPFETRSTIAPPSLFAPASFGGFAAPVESAAAKRAASDKGASLTAPDPSTLAANPVELKKFKVNGMRSAPTRPAPLASALPAAPTLPPAAEGVGSQASMSGPGGDGFADLMARNIERYMSLKNKRPAPSRIDQSF